MTSYFLAPSGCGLGWIGDSATHKKNTQRNGTSPGNIWPEYVPTVHFS